VHGVYYELIEHPWLYLIHKVVQLDTPEHTFAGLWRRAEASLVAAHTTPAPCGEGCRVSASPLTFG
jgi:hypothetical protein